MAAGEDELPPELDEARIEAEAVASMMDLTLEQVVHAGHEAMLRLLVAKVRARTIKHQEMAILRNMLRDNGMTLGLVPNDGDPKNKVIEHRDLPQLAPPDYEEQ